MQLHTTSRRRFLAGVGVAGVSLGATPMVSAHPERRNFRTHLTADEEVDPEVESDAQGQAVFQFSRDGDELAYKLIVANIENVHAAHIHLAPAGENGPVVAWLYPEDGPPDEQIDGRFDGVLAEGVVTADDLVGPLGGQVLEDLLELMVAGDTYVNVHTLQHLGGEIRGQIH